MAYAPGRFCWYELMTSDTAAAKEFYRTVIGWDFQDTDMTGEPYTMVLAGETAIGGVMSLPPEVAARGGRPGWMGYIAVDDVDGAAEAVIRLGGRVHHPPTDIPHVGRFSVVADPQGAAFVLFQPGSAPPPQVLAPGTPGRVAWHELLAQDWPAAFDFYAEMFGWEKGAPIDMGAMGTYQLFSTGGDSVGGMFNKPPMAPAPFWQYYTQVTDITAATQRVTQAGGTVIQGPMEVPGGDFVIQAIDPQGAMFALVGKPG